MPEGSIGTPVRRREDYRFLTGQGTYTDDINRPGQLYAYILRSPHANARITRIETSGATLAAGVAAVFTAAVVSIFLIRAWACGLRTNAATVAPGSLTSST